MADRVIIVVTVILAGIYLYATEQLPALAFGDPLGPKAFPRLLVIGLFVTAALLLAETLRARQTPKPGRTDAKDAAGNRRAYAVLALVVAWTVLYFLVFEPLGYIVATTIYLFALMAYFNRGKWLANALTSVLFCAGSYSLFTMLLGVSLARGVLPF